jgi:uncharacterized FAD-dependent dehydrogenase
VKKTINYIETVIIGGGFSGLFISDVFIDKGYESFLLIEQNNRLGGYAISGDMKIGLLPAGNRTKQLLPPGFYEFYEEQFATRFRKYLNTPEKKAFAFNFSSVGLQNKYYNSFILSRQNGILLTTLIKEKINCHILFRKVTDISILDGCYAVQLSKYEVIRCKYLIISSGRSYSIFSSLKQIGQVYSEKHDILFGVRACFDSKNAENMFSHQPDFKVKDYNDYQTYCFNYRGNINSYNYNDRIIYSGSLDEKRLTGNCFIGKRLISSPDIELKKIKEHKKISYQQFLIYEWLKPVKVIFEGIGSFMHKLEQLSGLKFTYIYYPALEQFWARPNINNMTLESTSLPNVFYIGDASGISFGVMQCYITSHVLLNELENRNVFH